jgi:hypothetical protein
MGDVAVSCDLCAVGPVLCARAVFSCGVLQLWVVIGYLWCPDGRPVDYW